ncbi:hypothetical protein [Plantactinospora sp. KBS50]|uniref:hypothetical protein n=1 Tax=Plantactinospora sp. KBS50 TaxID=2024580 RepID=UPI0012FD1AB0|nr:hypothetical protein [Plantactinospora sp. KBS50]
MAAEPQREDLHTPASPPALRSAVPAPEPPGGSQGERAAELSSLTELPAPAPAAELPVPHRAHRAGSSAKRPVIRGLPLPPPPLPGFEQPFPIQRVDSVGASDRMLGLCGWATGIGVLGTAAAIRGLVAIRAGTAPGWYEPTLATVGLAAVVCTVAAFTLVRRARLPWLLLSLATVPLLVNVGLTVGVL